MAPGCVGSNKTKASVGEQNTSVDINSRASPPPPPALDSCPLLGGPIRPEVCSYHQQSKKNFIEVLERDDFRWTVAVLDERYPAGGIDRFENLVVGTALPLELGHVLKKSRNPTAS